MDLVIGICCRESKSDLQVILFIVTLLTPISSTCGQKNY